MRLLDRYIAKTVLSSMALVTLMLAGLQIFILFIRELNDIGKMDYGIIQVIQFVLLQMPYQVYLFFPMASLLGCLSGLGVLANHHELVVMRAAGMSILQITMAVLKAALIVIIIVTVVGETVIPKLVRISNDHKIQALSDGQTLRTINGVWLRYHNNFIAIESILSNHSMKKVQQFRFDKQYRMRLVRKIDSIDFVNGVWQAHGIDETLLLGDKTQARHIDHMVWDVDLQPRSLGGNRGGPDEFSLWELKQYLHHQKMNQQVVRNFQLAYLQRIVQPLSTIVMMVLAIPFIFGPLRSSTMGSKFLVGATLGFGFSIVNRFFGPISQLFQWPPEVAAFAPTCVFALFGLYLIRRMR